MKLMDCVKKECKFVEVAFKDWSDKMEDLIFVLRCLVIYIVYQLVPYKSEVTMVLIYGIGLEVTFNCSASRPKIEGKTNEKKEVQTETLTIKATPLSDGKVKAKTGDTTDATCLCRLV